jgi:ribosome-associated protein
VSYSNHLYVNEELQIPFEEFDISYARSGGPGGQNVNKVSSKAVVRWLVTSTPSLPDPVRHRFIDKYSSRLTSTGELIITSQKFRDQPSNFEDCMEKLRAMIESVIAPPKPRRATKPSKAAKQRRLDGKQEMAQKKQSRRAPRFDD